MVWTRLGLLTLSLLLTACGGGGGGGSSETTSNGAVAVNKRLIEANATCPNGGIEIDMGVDTNKNGLLDAGEISSTETVCNGNDGAVGADGTDGANGTSAAVRLTASTDASCPFGGTNIDVGIDTNANGTLDDAEVLDSSLICHAQSSVVAEEFALSAKGKVVGQLDMALIPTPKSTNGFSVQSRSRSITSRKVTSQAGTLWLTPNDITAAIQADQAALDQANNNPGSDTQITPPVIAPIEIPVAADGSYSIDVPAGTDYSLTYVSADATQAIKIDDVNVTPNQETIVSIGQQDLIPAGAVTFVVQSLASNTPIESATVTLLNDATTTTTDASGAASFEGLAQGSYTLLVAQSGFVSQTFAVQITSGQTLELGVLQLNNEKGSASGALSVDVALLTSLENIVVYARDTRGGIYSTLTDANGAFSFNALPVANGYSFIAQANDFSADKITDVNITANTNTEVGSIELKAASTFVGSISGFAKFSDKLAVLNTHAGLLVAVEGTDKEAVTSRDGAFILNGLSPGRYTLNFTDSNYQTTTIENIRVVATATTSLAAVNLQLKTGQVSGIVSLDKQVNAAGVLVEILGTPTKTYTDNTGRWYASMPVGNYGDGIKYSKALYASVTQNETVTITNQGEYTAQAQALIQNAMTLVIPVTAVGNCSQLEVWLQGQSGNAVGFDQTFPVSNGELSVVVPYGEYRVETRCQDSGFETWVQNITLTNDNTGQLISTIAAVELRQSYVKINSGDALTSDANVILSLGSTNAAQMSISGNVSATGWIAYTATHNLALTGGDGLNSINVEYRDVNNLSLGNNSASITLDTTVTISNFTATGASTKGDTLLVSLDLNGDLNATVIASLPGLFTDYALLDNGVLGDSVANDGIYSRAVSVSTPLEINAPVSASATDKAGNTTSANTAVNVVTNSAPGIINLQINSSIATQEMNLSFDTNEATTSSISWGDAADNLSTTIAVSTVFSPNHTVLLTGLSSVDLTYYQITVTDGAGNITHKTGINKLAPNQVENVIATPGDLEIGVVWNPNEHPYTDGYRVYRSEDNAVFTLANSDQLLKGSYYVDNAVQNGSEYFYKVTAVDRDGNEGILSAVASTIAASALAGPTVITADELWGEHVWIASRSPYIINKDLATRHKARLRALPGTNIQLDATNGYVEFKTSNVGHVWLMGEEGNRVVVEQIGATGSPTLALKSQDDKNAVFLTSEVDPVTRYTPDYFPLAGNLFRYVNLLGESNFRINRGSEYYGPMGVGYEINAEKIAYLQFGLIVGGYLRNSRLDLGAGMDLNVVFDDDASKTYQLLAYGSKIDYLGNSSIAGIGEGSAVSLGSFFADNVDYDNTRVVLGGSYPTQYITHSRFRNIESIGNPAYITESVFETTNGCNGVDVYNLRNVVWLDKTLAELKDCGVRYLHTYLPFLTSQDPLHDQDNDGIPDQMDHDSDNDGFSDVQELTGQQLFDPFDANSKPDELVVHDHDGDTIPDVDDTDDDNDGISDVDEIAYGTSPYWADSDGDGVIDKIEITYGYNPLDRTNAPLMGTRIGIELFNESFKNDVNQTHVLPTQSALIISYFYMGVQHLRCYLCEINTNQKLYSNNSTNNSAQTFFYYLNVPFEPGRQLRFYNEGSTNVYFQFNKSQIYNFSNAYADDISVSLQRSSFSFGSLVNGTGGHGYSYIYKSVMTAGNNGVYESLIKSSIVTGASYNSQVIDSHVNINDRSDFRGAVYRNSSIIDTENTGSLGTNEQTYFYDSYLQNVRVGGTLIRSDYVWSDSISLSLSNQSSFLNSSYLEIDGNNILSVGAPEDNLGDGVADTVVDYIDLLSNPQTFNVDGIASPKSTPYFPGGADSVILLNDIGPQ